MNRHRAGWPPVLTPSELIQTVNALLASHLSRVTVEGEIASLRASAAGHLYFELRDASAVLPCVLFARARRQLALVPADGLKVQATGTLSIYAGQGRFQLIVEQLQDAGEGELLRAFLALKSKLEQEGLFDRARKPPLPRWPKRLALLTSREGAVLHDVLTILARRFPLLPIELYPVPVQGREAAPAIIAALQRVIARGSCDVVLIARGGGSLSDLAAFNDEGLARAIAASPLPVVSAIGHETDYTIADFVASLRAPTPSAAAELIAPNRAELLDRLDRISQLLRRQALERLQLCQQRLDEAERMLRAYTPSHGPLALALEHRRTRLIAASRQRFGAWSRRLDLLLPRLIGQPASAWRRQQTALADLVRRLDRARPSERIGFLSRRLEALHRRLTPGTSLLRLRLEALAERLRVAHPERRLSRWRQRLEPVPVRLFSAVQGLLAAARRPLPTLRERLLRSEPRPRLSAYRARLSTAVRILRRLPPHRLRLSAERLLRLEPVWLGTAMGARLSAQGEALSRLGRALAVAMRSLLRRGATVLNELGRGLERLGPRATLRRGYAILLDAEGRAVVKAAQTQAGQPLAALLAEGRLELRVERSLPAAPNDLLDAPEESP